jgi:hypothetical protein
MDAPHELAPDKDRHTRASTRFQKETQMKSHIACFVLAAAVLPALTQSSPAQGTSGATGVVASIPGSVVRDHQQGPGLFSIIAGSPPPNQSPDSRRRTTGPGEAEQLSRQKTGK